MLNYIVLGQIPGTNLHVGFIGYVLICVLLSGAFFGYRLFTAPFDGEESDSENLEEIAL